MIFIEQNGTRNKNLFIQSIFLDVMGVVDENIMLRISYLQEYTVRWHQLFNKPKLLILSFAGQLFKSILIRIDQIRLSTFQTFLVH